MSLTVLPLMVVLQFMPPPVGRMASALVFGRIGGGTDVIVAVPLPAPTEDCHCGVPSSPRGPR